MILHSQILDNQLRPFQYFRQCFQSQNIWIISLYSIMMNRSKKLTLEAPYSKITKILWQNKKNNSQKQKQNLQLKTRLNYIHNSKLHKPYSKNLNKVEQKYEKLIAKVKEQNKWISQTNDMIEERKYQQLKLQVKKLEIKLSKITNKAVESEKKMQKYCSKISQLEDPTSTAQTDEHYKKQISPFYELQNEKQEMLLLIQSKQQYSQQVQMRSKLLNKEIIQLLSIKNELRNQVRQLKMNNSKLSFCKNIQTYPYNHD